MFSIDFNNLAFESDSLVNFLHAALAGSKAPRARKPRGSLQKLAFHLGCHPSFLNQVLSETSLLSTDQTLMVAEYFGLEENATDQLMDLALLARSGTARAKSRFSAKLHARRSSRDDLQRRWNTKDDDWSERQTQLFFSDWKYQVVYSLLHIEKLQKPEELIHALDLPPEETHRIMRELLRCGIVVENKKRLLPQKGDFLHVAKNSPFIRGHHQSWRLRSLDEFNRQAQLRGVHYSGAITVSAADANQIRKIVLASLDQVRGVVKESSSEQCHGLILDYFQIS